MGFVFQDPMSALNPRMRVDAIVTEPLRAHGRIHGRRETSERAAALLGQVGLDPAFAARYPHEFSGGQRQRIGIARAIATSPRLVILDEPISALDISIRAQILNLLSDLQQSLGLSYVLIAHDLAVVRHVCDRIAVMYLGIIVEQGPTEAVFTKPMHPYTQALIACVPTGEPARRGRRPQLEGDVPSPVDVPSGCRFRTRCPLATERCAVEAPPMRAVGDGRTAACWALPVQ
jgi:oligopeptide/dipeptide ABC transporter ATP-binding protein